MMCFAGRVGIYGLGAFVFKVFSLYFRLPGSDGRWKAWRLLCCAKHGGTIARKFGFANAFTNQFAKLFCVR
jgi:hypothetical protein